MSQKCKKNLVLFILFIFPILTYLFFASGVNHFARLPIVHQGIADIEFNNPTAAQLKNKITVLGYWGNLSEQMQIQAFHLKEIIYSRFNGFTDFQFVILIDSSAISESKQLIKTLNQSGKIESHNWLFVASSPQDMKQHHASLKTPFPLDTYGTTPYVYIVDKNLNLRGRDDRKKREILFGYDSQSIVELSDKMVDDIKVLLAEYRLALKEKPTENNSAE